MEPKFYKCCAVPQCKSTTIKTPEKLFIHVPRTKTMRKMWLQLARRDPALVSTQSKMYFCEDHFDLPNDMENYPEYNLMGTVSQIRLRAGCLPRKFACQPDRKRRTEDITTRPLAVKRQRVETIAEYEREIEQTHSSQSISVAEVQPGPSSVFKMGKTNAEHCKNYYNRKKAAKEAEKVRQGLSVKKTKKTGAERSRAYRLRKIMLSQVSELSTTEILSTPSTSNSRIRTFEPSFQLATTSAITDRPDVKTVSSIGIADHDRDNLHNSFLSTSTHDIRNSVLVQAEVHMAYSPELYNHNTSENTSIADIKQNRLLLAQGTIQQLADAPGGVDQNMHDTINIITPNIDMTVRQEEVACSTVTLDDEPSKMMEVIDLDRDETVTDNNKKKSGVNEKESKASVASTSNQEIVTETITEEKTDDKQANLTPGANSRLDLDKFKRRLIRVIARSLLVEKKPEDTFWKELKKVTSCDCKILWTRMRALTIKKLKRLFAVEDKAQHVTKIVRLSVTDWLLIDLVLVHEKVDVIGQDDQDDGKDKKEPKMLESLFKLVLKYNTERLSGDKLTEAWFNAASDYNKRGRYCSPMLLQRRWYQLKELAWYNFYNFWFSYRGDARNLDSAGRFKPTYLQTEIIKHFSRIVTEQFQTWEQLIEQKKVVLLEDFERYKLALKKGTNTGQENEPDLVVIEPHVETIDLRLEPDSDSDIASDTNEAERTTNNTKINLSIVKSETIDEISDGDDISMLEAVDIPLESLEQSHDTINENTDNDTNVIHINDNTTISDSDEVISDNDEEIIDNDDKDAVVVNDSNDTIISLGANYEYKELVESTEASVEFNKSIVTDVNVNKNHENDINSVGNNNHRNISSLRSTNVGDPSRESNQNIKKHDDCVVQDINDYNMDETTKLHQDTENITNVQGLLTNLISDIKKETTHIPEKQNMNILYDVTSNIGVYMNGLELEDDGIEYFEEDDDDDVTEIVDNADKNVEEDCRTDNKDPPKIDLKLLLQAVVYTKRLNEMDIFRFIDYKTVKDARIINEAIIESIPVHKKTFKMEDISECQNTYKSDESNDDVLNDNECQERLNYKSWYFKKPKISTYNPIQLCKNPDFNTRLKRLTAGFFSSERNRRLLKECKPLTIDVYKSFEIKLNNNSLVHDEFPSETIKRETIEPTPQCVEPIEQPIENPIGTENVLDTSKQCINVRDLPNHSNEEPQIVERNKVIILPDIDQIRRANEKLLIAEVTPIQVSSISNKPPVEIFQHNAYTQNIKEHYYQNKKVDNFQNMEKCLSFKTDTIDVDSAQPTVNKKDNETLILEPKELIELENEISKKCPSPGLNVKKRKRNLKAPPVKPPATKTIREFVTKGIPTDRLLALDTIERILGICQYNVDPMKIPLLKITNKAMKLRKDFLKKTNFSKQGSTNDNESSNIQNISIENKETVPNEIPVKDKEHIVNTPIVTNGNLIENINKLTHIHGGKKEKQQKSKKKLPRSIYCCWAREKTVSLTKSHKRLLSAHTCPLPLCSCCCREDYMKALGKLCVYKPNTFSGVPECLAINEKLSLKSPKCIVVEKVARGMNTDYNPEYALNLREASKIPFYADANNDILDQNLYKQNQYLSSETTTLDKISQVQQIQTKDVHVDVVGELNPIITNVQSLSHTPPVVLQDVQQTNDNKATTSSTVKCKTNVLYSVGPSYLTQPTEQIPNVPEPLTQLTVVIPDSKAYLQNKKLQKTPNSICLGNNKILLCSKQPKDETKKQVNEPFPPQLVMLNNETLPEGVNVMLPLNNQMTLPIDSELNVDPNRIQSIPMMVSVPEEEHINNISNPNVASCVINANIDNANSYVASEENRDERIDENIHDKAMSKGSGALLTQGENDIGDEPLRKSPELNESFSIDSTVSQSKSHRIDNNKSYNEIKTIAHKSGVGSAKKTILSDLMEMSGISLEDTTVNSESTELTKDDAGVNICKNNVTETIISNVSPDVVSNNLDPINALNTGTGDQIGTLALDLNVVSSLYDLKQAYDKKKQFYKMDIETGQIIPINVSIKKHTKPKYKPMLPNTVIDLTDDGEKEKDAISDPPPDVVKQSEAVRPLKLYKTVHPTLLRASGKSILRNPVIIKKGYLQRKRNTLTQILNRKRKEQMKYLENQNDQDIMECNDNSKTANSISSDSDDEPLAFKAKRKKNDDDDNDNNDKNTEDKTRDENMTEITETLGVLSNKPDIKLTSVNAVLEPVVFNDSSDEDCILGV